MLRGWGKKRIEHIGFFDMCPRLAYLLAFIVTGNHSMNDAGGVGGGGAVYHDTTIHKRQKSPQFFSQSAKFSAIETLDNLSIMYCHKVSFCSEASLQVFVGETFSFKH